MRGVTAVLRWGLAVAGLLAVCVFGPTASADPDAGGSCVRPSRAVGDCQFAVTIPGSSADADGATSDADEPEIRPADDEGAACYNEVAGADIAPGPVPCVTDAGYWSPQYGCYLSPTPLADQPPRNGPGVDPVTGATWTTAGALYECTLPGGGVSLVWLDAPPTPADLPPTPGEVARHVVAQMDLRAIQIGVAPPEGSVGVVGVPVWLWVQSPGSSTFGSATATATLEGVTVTATAIADEVRWDLGDGTQISCGAGTPYRPEFGGEPSPDCGHVYTRESGYEPGRAYTVTATTTWVVQWVGAGQTGTITLDPLVAETQVVVAEGQVLVG